MIETGIGRLLVASLHQSIADLLPTRLEFYEEWFKPEGLRDGRIGLAPMAAVLSFLRQEGEAYQLVAERAGEYAAEWMVADLPAVQRAMLRGAPRSMRVWLVMRVARQMIRRAYTGSRAIVRWRGSEGVVDVRASIFCGVRDQVSHPLCEFYASAIRRLMVLFNIDAEIGITSCRAAGGEQCMLSVSVRAVNAGVAA